jgi:hypothetical protein
VCGEEEDFKQILNRNEKNGDGRNVFSQSGRKIQLTDHKRSEDVTQNGAKVRIHLKRKHI